MKIILNHKTRIETSDNIVNNLVMIQSYLKSKSLQEYIDYEDIIDKLKQSILQSQQLYSELTFLYRKLGEKR